MEPNDIVTFRRSTMLIRTALDQALPDQFVMEGRAGYLRYIKGKLIKH